MVFQTDKHRRTTIKQRKNGRFYKFCPSWLTNNDFKDWKTKAENNPSKMSMHICNVNIIAHKNDIKRHGISTRHKENLKAIATNRKITDLLANNTLKDDSRRAELKLCALLGSNNLPFILMDTLTPLLGNIFIDSKIAQNISLKRTKATVTLKQALGDVFSTELYDQLSRPGSFFFLIMDETTDRGTVIYCCVLL